MSLTTDVWIPERTLTTNGKSIVIREMSWRDTLKLTTMLGDFVLSMVTPEGKPQPLSEIISGAVMQSETAVEFVLTKSTDLDSAQIDRLPASTVVQIVATAIVLTLNDDTLSAGKALAERLRLAFGASPTASLAPSTS